MAGTARAPDVRNSEGAVAALVGAFREAGSRAMIANLDTRVEVLRAGGHVFPVTFNDAGSGTCYICCPSTAYIDYAMDEARNFAARPALAALVRGSVRACAPLVRAAGLDHQVQVNNWLYSTNPLPALDGDAAREMRDALVARHPDRAVVLRSLNAIADAPSIAALRSAGFRMLPMRRIWILDHAGRTTDTSRSDRARLRRTPLCRVDTHEFGRVEGDYERARELYDLLYLDKYTPLNPHYTARYVREMHRRGVFEMAGLRDGDDRLVAVTALFRNGNTLTQPVVGYDTALPASLGLYRLAMLMAQDHAREHGLFFNMSAGAGGFKRRRGAVPAIEFMAVHVAHLPAIRRAATAAMETVLHRVGVPLLEGFDL